MSTDAIVLLKEELVNQILEALTVHTYLENEVIAMRPEAPRSPKDPKAIKSARDAATA
ncbi:hypothetical protein [Micromonospora sp. NPDC005806]|uniref:hypothetical protein n=1 Tax=Micromonospora sp. NPDC005806 TaxID=3364234 RepID=UPI0036937707